MAIEDTPASGQGASRIRFSSRWVVLAALLLSPVWPAAAQDVAPPDAAAAPAAPTFKAEEIEQLVAPIALYPDSLLAQVLMASTYPLEVVEAARWSKNNPKVKDKALEEAMQKQSWDPSVKSLTAFPQVLTMMDEKLQWTQDLGDAFLAQQKDVMAAVQRLRAKAQAEGNLKSTKEQTVKVEPAPPVHVEQNVNVQQPAAAPAAAPSQTIIIEPANPQVVYVPSYPPTVYGAWPYPAYPPYYYYPPGYAAGTALLSFGVGMAVGSALWGDCNWGGGDVDIDVNNYNNFNKTDIKSGEWNHNSEHRKGAQYRDKASQQKYGREDRQAAQSREQFRGRAEQGRQDIARGDADRFKGDAGRQGGRDGGRDARGDAGRDRSAAGRDQRGDGRGAASGRDRASAGRDAGANRAPQRDVGGAQRGRDSSAFGGAGHGSQARRDMNRGQASRRSASASGFGGGSGGRGGGGGGRGGGGRGRR